MKHYHTKGGQQQLNEGAEAQRSGLRAIGFVLLGIGGIFALVGFVDFFSSFGNFGDSPDKFWCVFVGMPLVAGGIACLKLGYVGAVSRYFAGETAPVVKDTTNYVIDGTKDSVVGVVREALGNPVETAKRVCPKCTTKNEADAKFCKSCGTSLPTAKRCSCGELNDADAKFCDECGKALKGAKN